MSSTLHPIEQRILSSLMGGGLDFEQLTSSTALKEDQVRRALSWLSSKHFVEVAEHVAERLVYTGIEVPELALVERLQGSGTGVSMDELRGGFKSADEFSAAVGRARRSGWIEVRTEGPAPAVLLIDPDGPASVRELLAKTAGTGVERGALSGPEQEAARDLLSRGVLRLNQQKQVSVKITADGRRASLQVVGGDYLEKLTPEIITSGSWKGKKLRPIDVEAKPPHFYPGRRHPVRDFIREVREAYISMGFTELQGNSVHPAFWNFDALFIPQDHPGRDMQDTFYVEGMTDEKLTRSGVVQKVAAVHENGGGTGSRGWRHPWRIEEARRLVLRTHNTVLTVKALSESPDQEARVFAVSKVYRNENLDYKHLAEFYQMDGIIVGKGLNVRHLMGFLTEFYKKLGMKDVKLWPTYFPYTEPSLQVVGYSEAAKDWVELGGSGVFRPEVTWPLGVKVPVLAWGPGIERLMLLKYGLDDLRALYETDLGWLRDRVEIARS